MSNRNYFFYATHNKRKNNVSEKLKAAYQYESLDSDLQKVVDGFVSNYQYGDNLDDYTNDFVNRNSEEVDELLDIFNYNELHDFLYFYLGYFFKWGSAHTSFTGKSGEKASEIPESELIQMMTDPKEPLKGLLDSAGGNLSVVKPYLPAIIISLDTNTRNKQATELKHTGRFCFDFDKFKDTDEAISWMNTLWNGTQNVKPYMAFISPRGKGVKMFCQVDTSDKSFQTDFNSKVPQLVKNKHKVWYEGAVKEFIQNYPVIETNIDQGTNDVQRLTFIPFIEDKATRFKYNPDRLSNYAAIRNQETALIKARQKEEMTKYASEIEQVKKEQNISSDEEAYRIVLQEKSYDFDLELEKEKLEKTIDFIEDLIDREHRVASWAAEKFDDYATLNKQAWVLFGIFGDFGIEQLKRLVPVESNKLNENHNDYRWAIKSDKDYSDEQLKENTLGGFYKLILQIDEVKDFLVENYYYSSGQVSEFRILRDLYQTYIRNKDLEDNNNDQADRSEHLDQVTVFLDKKRKQLPLIEQIENLPSEITLGPSEYLSNKVMHELFQNKYANKNLFYLISQCGT